MRQGDSDRDIARGGLMGRKKLTTVRREAEVLGRLDPVLPLPDNATIAAVFRRLAALAHTCMSTAEPFLEQICDGRPLAFRAPRSMPPFNAITATPSATTP